MTALPRSILRGSFVAIAAASLASSACRDTTAPVKRYAVLDDVGQNDWQMVSAGGHHTCALKSNGNAYCWGDNSSGQLGIARSDTVCGTGKTRIACSLTPIQVHPGLRFTLISAGARHTCGIATSREAYCWGANDKGQVSDAVLSGPTLTRIAGSLGWSDISAGYSHTCAVRTDGAVFCWGSNERGQLGNGRIANSNTMVNVSLPESVASVSAGQQRTCARSTVGTVYCWGATWTARQDGLEVTRAQLTPQLVPAAPKMESLSVGSFTTCGAGVSLLAYCWEANPRGEMGTGTQTGDTMPARVLGNLGFVQVSAGVVQSCGVSTSGTGYCWGDDTFGQLGVSQESLIETCGGQQLPCSTTPVAVFGRQQFTGISVGFGSHACGVTVAGNLYCWGLGLSGQRGDGTENYATSIPIMVAPPAR